MSTHTHRSPGVTAIFNAVKRSSKKNGILDLGTATGTNLSFYTQLGCHFHFESFDQAISEVASKQISEQELSESFLKYIPKNKKYDVVLLWDVFNYLPQSMVASFVTDLISVIKPGALVHMINYVGSTMPAVPAQISIKDQYHLEVSHLTSGRRVSRRATTTKLLKVFPRFQMMKSYLNGEGMVAGFSEQILRFETGAKSKGEVFSSGETSDSARKISVRLHSPGISGFVGNSSAEQSLLDLGAKRALNYDYWKQVYNTVVASDLIPVLQRYSKCHKEEKAHYLSSSRLLTPEPNKKFDVIVAWDLLNYCDDDLLKVLGRRIAEHSTDGTQLVAMVYSTDEVPKKPQLFLVDKKGIGLPAQPDKASFVKNPNRLTSTKLQKFFPGFYVEQSFAFRPGMQKGMSEYLFIFKDEARIAREKEKLIASVMARRAKAESTS